MLLLRWIHLVGGGVLFGAIVGAGIANRAANGAKDGARTVDQVTFGLLRFANAGLVLLLVSGVGIIAMTGNPGGWFKAPWMHVMLTAFVGAGAVIGIAQGKARRLAEGDADASARRTVSTLSMVGMLLVLAAYAAGAFRF